MRQSDKMTDDVLAAVYLNRLLLSLKTFYFLITRITALLMDQKLRAFFFCFFVIWCLASQQVSLIVTIEPQLFWVRVANL